MPQKQSSDLMQGTTRCTARRKNGQACRNWAILGGTVCRMHGGAAPQVRAAAKVRIAMAQEDAASVIVQMMHNPQVPFAERRRCAEFLLTYENRNDLVVEVRRFEENIEGILIDVADGADAFSITSLPKGESRGDEA